MHFYSLSIFSTNIQKETKILIMTFSFSNTTPPDFLCMVNPSSQKNSPDSRQQMFEMASAGLGVYQQGGHNMNPARYFNQPDIHSQYKYMKFALLFVAVVFIVASVGFSYGLSRSPLGNEEYTQREIREVRRTYRQILYTVAITMAISAVVIFAVLLFC